MTLIIGINRPELKLLAVDQFTHNGISKKGFIVDTKIISGKDYCLGHTGDSAYFNIFKDFLIDKELNIKTVTQLWYSFYKEYLKGDKNTSFLGFIEGQFVELDSDGGFYQLNNTSHYCLGSGTDIGMSSLDLLNRNNIEITEERLGEIFEIANKYYMVSKEFEVVRVADPQIDPTHEAHLPVIDSL